MNKDEEATTSNDSLENLERVTFVLVEYSMSRLLVVGALQFAHSDIHAVPGVRVK
jgi:hypothetical protein